VKRQSGKGNPLQMSVPTTVERHCGHWVQGAFTSGRMHSRSGVVSQFQLSSFWTELGMTLVKQNGKGEQVFGMLVAVGKRQFGNGEHSVLVGCGITLRENPPDGGRFVGSGKLENIPPGVGATPVNGFVNGKPRVSDPVTVDAGGKPNAMDRLVMAMPFVLVPNSVKFKGKGSLEGVKVPCMTVVNGLPCAFVPVEVKENG
jgi:hypothetical protein